MWASSFDFTDFAKKAQELQEQASSFKVPSASNSLFNLDSMQANLSTEDGSKPTSTTTTTTTTTTTPTTQSGPPTTTSSGFPLPSMETQHPHNEKKQPSLEPGMQQSQKESIPTSSAATPQKQQASTTQTKETAEEESSEVEATKGESGWDDDELPDLDTQDEMQKPSTHEHETQSKTETTSTESQPVSAVQAEAEAHSSSVVEGDQQQRVVSETAEKGTSHQQTQAQAPNSDAAPSAHTEEAATLAPDVAIATPQAKSSNINDDAPQHTQNQQEIDRGDEKTVETQNTQQDASTAKDASTSRELRQPAEKSIVENVKAQAGAAVPDQLLEQFSSQIARLEENFQNERREMEAQHARALQEALQASKRDEAERKRLEEQLRREGREKDQKFWELSRANEGYKLKLDALQRELAGAKEIIEAKDNEKYKLDEAHLRDLRQFERKVVEAEAHAEKQKEAVKKMQAEVETKEQELAASKKDHADLKERVRLVAAELKDRRVECRELRAKLDETTETNEHLQEQVSSLEAQLSSHGRDQSERDSEFEQLRAKLADADAKLEKAVQAGKERAAESEKALADYKRKAQASLSLANSRTAAAVQAKEEAELEARAARSTADSAMGRAVAAELASKQAQAEAQVAVKIKEQERKEAVAQLEESQARMEQQQSEMKKLQRDLDSAISSRDNLAADLEQARTKLREAQVEAAEKDAALHGTKGDCKRLREELDAVRQQLKHAEEELQSGKQQRNHDEKVRQEQKTMEKASDRTTIVTLQEELKEANEAIEGLKEALRNVVRFNEEDKASNGSREQPSANGGDSTPLLYAMEKQAELNTARNEINRLANLLSDVQAEKTAADEAVEEMRKRMEDAEARLRRFEKLSPGVVHDTAERLQNGVTEAPSRNSGAVNIEYLKNIMMRYLTAKTMAEKKGLLPVIAAVLCLTPDEQQNAVKNLEDSTSLGGVSSSLLESFKFS